MTDEEFVAVGARLGAMWPVAFSATLLAKWAEAILPMTFEDVSAAIRKCAFSESPPTLDQILRCIRQSVADEWAKQCAVGPLLRLQSIHTPNTVGHAPSETPSAFPILTLNATGRRHWYYVTRDMEGWNTWKIHCVRWWPLSSPDALVRFINVHREG